MPNARRLSYEELPKINSERWLSLEDLRGESWKNIKGYEGIYKISDYGRVKSLKRFGKQKTYIKKLTIDHKGYIRINLCKNCKSLIYAVHRLVAMAFVGDIPSPDMEIDHIDAIRDDNRRENLHWVTRIENARNPISYERARQSRIGKPRPLSVRKVLSEGKIGAKNPMYGRCGKLSHRSKKVIQMDADGNELKTWDNITFAIKAVGSSHISACCKGYRNMAGGYKWKYAQ